MDAAQISSSESQTHQPPTDTVAGIEDPTLDTFEKITEYLSAITEFDDAETQDDFLSRANDEIARIFSAIDALPKESIDPAELAYLKGKVLNNLKEEYDHESETLLQRATTLRPTHVDSWLLLGEVKWKNQDFVGAKQSFENAIKHSEKPNKVALQQLSMALRHIPSDEEFDPEKNLRLAIVKAKEAIALDFADGDSWYFLGNAHLTLFLQGARQYDLKELHTAMMAFKQSEKTIFGVNKMDMYHNKAVIHRYLEDYQEAFTSYSLAWAQDQTWDDPKKAMDDMVDMLASIKEAVHHKKANNLPTKKRATLLSSLPSPGSSVSNFVVIPIQSLNSQQTYEGHCVVGRLVSFISNSSGIPQIVVLSDGAHDCISVSIYNIGPDVLQFGDEIMIPNPIVKTVKLERTGEVAISYAFISVPIPTQMLINGKVIARQEIALAEANLKTQ